MRSICDSDGWLALCERLQNNRPSPDYLRVYRDRKTGLLTKSRNMDRKKPWKSQAIWAWDTLNQTASVKTSIGFYSQSYRTGLTFWGALDFDLHGDVEDRESALLPIYRESLAAFHRLADQFPAAIVIFDGNERGFHVWLILEQQIPVSSMHEHMTDACAGSTEVEIIPSPRVSRYGKALRAPGTWNPAIDRVSMILGVAGPDGVIPGCRFWLAGTEALLPERGFVLSLFFRATNGEQPETHVANKKSREEKVVRNPEQVWNDCQDRYFIERPKTRHKQLLKLAGECSYQYGTDVVLRFAELQFDSKTVPTEATKEEHLEEARRALDGMHVKWLKKQANPAEALYHNNLRTVTRQDAFRILHNFAKMAEVQSADEFYTSHRNLAERLNITKPGAARMIADFIEGGAFMQTRPETTHRARRYRWLLG